VTAYAYVDVSAESGLGPRGRSKSPESVRCYAGLVDPELQQAFAQLEAHLTVRLDATEARLQTRLDGVDNRLEAMDNRLEAVETRLLTYVNERIEITETKLLTAFHNWAQTFEVRARGTSAAVRDFDERLGMIEERVAKLERSRN
jgi:hypothetical protein